MIVPIENYQKIPRDALIFSGVILVISFLAGSLPMFLGITVGSLVGIGSYISIMLMVTWCLGKPRRKIRWLFPLLFVGKYTLLMVLLYLIVTTPQIHVIGFFLGFSTIFFVIFWKGLLSLWYMFKFKHEEKGNIDV